MKTILTVVWLGENIPESQFQIKRMSPVLSCSCGSKCNCLFVKFSSGDEQIKNPNGLTLHEVAHYSIIVQ